MDAHIKERKYLIECPSCRTEAWYILPLYSYPRCKECGTVLNIEKDL